MSVKPLRSVLYVPGDKPRAIDKSRTLGADAVVLDLEDAVAPEHKDAARENVRGALANRWPCPVFVRVNGLGTPWEHADREMALLTGVDGLVLPKVEDARTVGALHLRVPLWPMIETPLGALHAAEIAGVPGVAGLIVGANDLARALRTRPTPSACRCCTPCRRWCWRPAPTAKCPWTPCTTMYVTQKASIGSAGRAAPWALQARR